MNESLFLLINADAGTSPVVLGFARFVADYLLYIVPLLLTVMWCWGERREAAFKALCVTLVALGLGQIISAVYVHPRPFMVPIGHTFAAHAADASFPSDHGILMFSVSLALMLSRECLLGSAVFCIGLLIAWSRIFLGIHFPFDMLGSLATAAVACAIVWLAWSPFGPRLMRTVEALYQTIFAFAISRHWLNN